MRSGRMLLAVAAALFLQSCGGGGGGGGSSSSASNNPPATQPSLPDPASLPSEPAATAPPVEPSPIVLAPPPSEPPAEPPPPPPDPDPGAPPAPAPTPPSCVSVAASAPTPASDPAFADGLGVTGRFPGTIAIGTAHAAGVAPANRFIAPGGAGLIIQNSIAVTDSGDVLAVWAERTSDANIACGNQGVVSGAWGSSAALSQVANLAVDPTDTGLPLRVNASGEGVLGWTEQLEANRKSRILRYTPGSGWAANAIDLLAPVGPLFGQAGPSDLQLLDDGRIEFSELVGVGTSDRAFDVYRQKDSGAPTVFVDFITSSSNSASNNVSIAADPQGNTITIRMLGGLDGLAHNSVGDFRASFFFSTVSVPACTYGVSTSTAAYTRPAYVAVSSARFSVFSVTTKDPSTPQCFLTLWTFDPGDGRERPLPLTTTPTTPGTYLFQPPVLAMDQAGNGVAVWQQWSGDPGAPTIVPVWARSTAGLAWGPPEIIGSNGSTIGVPEQSVPIRFALNRSGEGVAAMVVRRDGIPYITTARYSSSAGWSAWSLAASAPMFSIPNVAINEAADAFLIYAAQSCTRSATPPIPGSCGDTQDIYVLKLQP